jgi:hypothetical protein
LVKHKVATLIRQPILGSKLLMATHETKQNPECYPATLSAEIKVEGRETYSWKDMTKAPLIEGGALVDQLHPIVHQDRLTSRQS